MRKSYAILSVVLLMFVFPGCARQSQPATQQPVAVKSTADKGEIKLTSAAFKEGQPIPRSYTCDGADVSPPLEWSVPPSAKTLAIICDDPDAPAGTWVHWVLYNLPADKIGMIENTPATEKLAGGGMQGTNDFKKIGYGGPCPPSGTHRYFFKIYALDDELPVQPAASKAELLKAMEGHIVGQGQLMGTYKR